MEGTRKPGTRGVVDEKHHDLDVCPSSVESESPRRGSIRDAVFGEITDDGPDYRSVGWLGTVALMMKTQIGLGVLSIPAAFDTLGLIPGVICLLIIAGITTWSDYIVGVFKLRHRAVYGIDDAGQLMFGKAGKVIFGVVFTLFWIFVAGAAMIGISTGLNAVSSHGTCTAVFVAVAAIIAFAFSSIQTLNKISWLAWVGVFGIMIAVWTVTIAVGIQDRPVDAPAPPPGAVWKSDYKLVGNPSFVDACAALSSLVFAYAGTPAFFSIVSEMRDPQKYTRSLVACQSLVTVTYLVVGIVVYYYCGSYVASPALGSAGVIVKKVSYGFALPGLCVTAILVTHIPAKYIMIHILGGSPHLSSNTSIHWATWIGCTFACTLVSYVIASAIPVFDGLVSLVGALLGTSMCFQPMGCMWLYDNWSAGKRNPTLKWYLMVAFSVFVVVSGTFLLIGGTWGSVVGIMDSYKADGGAAAWSCADNSDSTGH